MIPSKQSRRIEEYLLAHEGQWIPAPTLSRIGSGKPDGWVSSFSKRTSEIRKIYGERLELREERVSGQRRTFYRLVPIQQSLWSQSEEAA